MNILQAEQELRHAYTNSMLANFAHIVKVKFKHALQLELVLEVVYYTGCISNARLLMNGATYQILVDVVLKTDGRDVVNVVQSLLNLRLLFRFAILITLTAILFSIFLLFYKYFSKQGTQSKEVIKI